MPSWYVPTSDVFSNEVMMMSLQHRSRRFDIYSLDKAGRQDEEGIQRAASESNLLCATELGCLTCKIFSCEISMMTNGAK